MQQVIILKPDQRKHLTCQINNYKLQMKSISLFVLISFKQHIIQTILTDANKN